MDWLQQLHFIRPYWLFAFIPLLLLAWYGLRQRHTSQSWKAVCDAELLPHVLTHTTGTRNMLSLWLATLAASLAIIAVAGPAWEKLPQPVFRDQSAVVIALDLSQSMDATDVKPSRLSRARLKLLDILKLRGSGQTALLVYAADAFVVAPLTDDTDTISHLVSSLETSIMPSQGSDVISAIDKANDLLQQAGITNGHIILMTDGIREQQLDAVASSMLAKHSLSIIGFGTTDGGPVPLTGGFLTDRDGNIVIPGLEEELLRQAAAAGSGLYRSMRNDDSDILDIMQLTSTEVDMQQDATDLAADVWREEGPWLLLLVIPLAALSARRGWLGVFVIMLLPLGDDATAAEASPWQFNDLWRTPDQRAMQAFEQGDHASAAEHFTRPDWKASALYKQGKYQQSIDAVGEPASSDDFYNMANAMAKTGQLEAAIEAYEQALELDPSNEDAAYNRQLVQDAIEQQAKQQQQNKQQGDQQSDQQSDQQGDSDSEQDTDSQKDEQQQQSSQDQQQANNEQQQDTGEADSGEQDTSQPGDEMQQQQDEQASASDAQQRQSEMQQAERASEQQDAGKQAGDPEQLSQDESDEEARATDQWLQRIPDDPGGLLRRKFQYQYKQRNTPSREQQPW